MKLQNKLDVLLDTGYLNEIHEMTVTSDYTEVRHKSDSQITYYVSGYVALKMLERTKCNECCRLLLRVEDTSLLSAESCLARYIDGGCHVYPSESLTDLVKAMEDAFTYCLSLNKLKTDSFMDRISCLSVKRLKTVGCEQHKVQVTNQIIRFFIHRRGCVSSYLGKTHPNKKREKMKFLTLRRTT